MRYLIVALTCFLSVSLFGQTKQSDPLAQSETANLANKRYIDQVTEADNEYLHQVILLQSKHKYSVDMARTAFVVSLKRAEGEAVKSDKFDLAVTLRQWVQWYSTGDGTKETLPDLPKPIVPEKDRWITLFHSSDPSLWGTSVNDSNNFASTFDKVPENIKYLRLTNSDNQSVYVPIKKDSLTRMSYDIVGWDGTNKEGWNARQLGIYVKKWNAHVKGTIDTYFTSSGVRGYSGWGFGIRFDINDKQGYCWNGQEVKDGTFDMAVTTDNLTESEQLNLASRLAGPSN